MTPQSFIQNSRILFITFLTFCAVLLLAGTGTVRAASYYVDANSPNASDANSGTSETAPFLTIQQGANLAQPGDTVFIKNGTYGSFAAVRSGLSTGWITYKAYP